MITYTSATSIRYFADTDDDEFYWDVNGTGWAQPFGTVTADIRLTDGVDQALNGSTSCYQGAEGSTETCTIERTADGFHASVTDLGPYENMTVAVGFAPHTFRTPPTARDSWIVTVLPWVLGGVLLLALLAAVPSGSSSGATLRAAARHRPLRGAGGHRRHAVRAPGRAFGGGAPCDDRRRCGPDKAATLIEDPLQPADDRYTLELVKPDAVTDADDRSSMNALFESTDAGHSDRPGSLRACARRSTRRARRAYPGRPGRARLPRSARSPG